MGDVAQAVRMGQDVMEQQIASLRSSLLIAEAARDEARAERDRARAAVDVLRAAIRELIAECGL